MIYQKCVEESKMFYTNKAVAYEKINNIIKDSNIVCMKERGDRRNKILGVSYSEDGLRGVANKSGRFPYSGATNVKDAYKMPRNRNIVVEKFVPSERPTKEETLWIDKSYRLLNVR